MAEVLDRAGQAPGVAPHAGWVRVSHAILSVSILTLAFSGFVILMAHPRLYWGEVGNELTPALLELPISRNHQHGGFDGAMPFFGESGPVSASRTYDIFNQNGWARSLHFLAAWCLVLPGAIYLFTGARRGHFRAHILPARGELTRGHVWRDVLDHARFRIPPASGGPRYGVLQKTAYAAVVFGAAPLMVVTGLAMSPAVTAAFPFLLDVFGGFQSARTIHFFAFAALVLFVLTHIAMVVASGFRRQVRAITLGE
jgi:thiosulfate reductase cytochrome b subunit